MSPIRILHPYPALLMVGDKFRYLVIADLHIGFEERFTSSGVKINVSVETMISELFTLIDKYQPDCLLILGDVKASIARVSKAEWISVPFFLEKVSERVRTVIIKGNHDGGLLPLTPPAVEVINRGMKIGENGLIHGHLKVGEEFADVKRLIMGHIHPTYCRKGSLLSGEPLWLFLKARKKQLFKSTMGDDRVEIIIIPAFNRDLSVVGYRSSRGKIISPVLRRMKNDIDEIMIATLTGEVIGDLTSLEFVL